MATAAAEAPAEKEKGALKTMLAAAVSHEVRTQCFAVLGERVASPVELSRELLIDKGTVGYHVRALRDWGLIELVDTRQVRGATEHFYRAVEYPKLTDEQEATLKPQERRRFAEVILSMFCADAVRSLDRELLYRRIDHVMTRFAYDVDEQAWRETIKAYKVCFDQVMKIKEAYDQRVKEGKAGGEPFRVLSFLGMFEIPALQT